jgi:hypothetical protein
VFRFFAPGITKSYSKGIAPVLEFATCDIQMIDEKSIRISRLVTPDSLISIVSIGPGYYYKHVQWLWGTFQAQTPADLQVRQWLIIGTGFPVAGHS